MSHDDGTEHEARIHRGLGIGDPGAVRRTEHDDGAVTYHSLLILAPGEWTDSASGETIFYSPEAIEKLAENPDERVVDNSVNVNHQHQDQLLQVGSFDPESLQTDDEGNLFADVSLHGRTQASEDAIELMDLALETDGAEGAGGPSVEIPSEGERTEWDSDRGLERMVEFNLSGLAIVTNAASKDAAFAEQFEDRPVAMSNTSEPVRLMQHAGATDKGGSGQGSDMDEETLRSILSEATVDEDDLMTENRVRDIVQDELADGDDEEPEQELQDQSDFELVAGLLGQFLDAEGMDPDAPATEFVNFVENETDTDAAEIEPVLQAYLDEVDADSLEETPVSALQGFVDAELNESDAEGDEEGGDEEGEEMAAAEEIEELEEQNAELQSTVEELERRLEALEDEPQEPRSLRETADPGDEEESPPPTRPAGLAKNGEHFTR